MSVLIFNPHGDIHDRITSLGYSVQTTTNPAELTLSNLSNYYVLWIDYATNPSIYASQNSQIRAWVNGGGGLIVTQPEFVGNVTVFPPGFEVFIYDGSWPGNWAATIVNPTHPITLGLVDEDLSGNFDWVRSEDIGTNWDILAVDLETPSDVALLAGEYGVGRLVFNTGNFQGLSGDPGSDMYLRQMICWAGCGQCGVSDSDEDGIFDGCDNCPNHPNGPALGTCTSGSMELIGVQSCTIPGINESECGTNGYCSMSQEDFYPPGGNGIGDACDCESDFQL